MRPTCIFMKAPEGKIKLAGSYPVSRLWKFSGLLVLVLSSSLWGREPVRVLVIPPVKVGGAAAPAEAEGVASAIEYEIASPGAVETIPRSEMERLRREKGISASTEPGFDEAFDLARSAGARFIIWGSYQQSGEVYRFNMVVGDTSTETVKKLRSTRSDLFGVQDDLSAEAKKIVQQTASAPAKAVTLSAPAPEPPAAAPAAKPAASPQASTQPAPAAPVRKADPVRQARELFNLGVRLGDYSDRERDYYLKASALDPQFAEPHYALGELFYQRKQYRDALGEFERFLKMKPDAPESFGVRTVIAELRRHLGEPEPAAPVVTPVPAPVQPEPSGFQPSAEQKDWKAARWFNEGLKLETTDRALYLEYLRQAIRTDPSFAPAYYNLGYDFYERNDYPQARAHFEKYLELAPRSADAPSIRELVETLKRY